MSELEHLNRCIGKKLVEGKVVSFFYNGRMSSPILRTLLRFDSWICIVTTDDQTKVYSTTIADEEIESFEEKGNKAEYPITNIEDQFDGFKKFIGKRLIKVTEIVSEKHRLMSYGLNFYFENNLNFVIYWNNYPIDKQEYFFKHWIPKGMIEVNAG